MQNVSQQALRQKGPSLMQLLAAFAVGIGVGVLASRVWGAGNGAISAQDTAGADDKQAEQQIRRLYDYERDLLLRRDFTAQAAFYPDDFVVTNPFNMFINKQKVMERLRADIIKYSVYDRQYDYFRRYGNTEVVVGSETVIPTPDAKRPDAGQTVSRRFTEVWVRRGGTWQKIVRHANNIAQPSDRR